MMLKKLLPLFFIIILVSVFNSPAFAVNMSSDDYKIQWGNINIGSGKAGQGGEPYRVGITMGQIAPGLYSFENGYIVRAGFQYIYTIIPFSFKISKLTIDFGTLTAETPATDSLNLIVKAGGAGGYQVLAFEDHPLRPALGADIPDTTCDTGLCDETNADPWIQTNKYGFGFNMTGDNISSDFADNTYFRQFANKEDGEAAQVIMNSDLVTRSATASATFKANVSPDQAGGDYQNSVVFIAVPKY